MNRSDRILFQSGVPRPAPHSHAGSASEVSARRPVARFIYNGGTFAAWGAPDEDLLASSFTSPAAAASKQLVPLSWTVTNTGDGAAEGRWYPGYWDRYYAGGDDLYLSADDVCCTGDLYVGLAVGDAERRPRQGAPFCAPGRRPCSTWNIRSRKRCRSVLAQAGAARGSSRS